MQTLYFIKMKGWNGTVLMNEDYSLYTSLPLAEKTLAALKEANKEVKAPFTDITYDTGSISIFSSESDVPLLNQMKSVDKADE